MKEKRVSYLIQRSPLEFIKLSFFWMGYLLLAITGGFYFYDKTLFVQLLLFAGLTQLSIIIFVKRNNNVIAKILFPVILCFSLGVVSFGSFFPFKRVYYRIVLAYYRQSREVKSLLHAAHDLINKQQINALPSNATLIATYANLLLRGYWSFEYPKEVQFWGKHFYIHSLPEFLLVYREVFLHREYHMDLGVENPFIIDCGSNIGLTTLFFTMVYPNAVILGFEPDATSFSLLQKNIAKNNLKNVSVINKGVAKEDRLAYLSGTSVGSAVSYDETAEYSQGYTKITLTKLSSYINRNVDLLKMDIEGSEMEVIEDLIQHNKLQLVNNIAMEVHRRPELKTFLSILKEHGFSCKVNETDILPILFASRKNSKA